jgi:Holliday junction resolvase RusA-like endonuclease
MPETTRVKVAVAGTSEFLTPGMKPETVVAKHLATILIPLEPLPASRPRVTKWGTYIAKPYKQWIDAALKVIPEGNLWLDKSLKLLVVTEAVCTKARTSKLFFPRMDVDNTAKAALDIITKVGGYWADDNQIVHLVTTKRFVRPDEPAHTSLSIYSL